MKAFPSDFGELLPLQVQNGGGITYFKNSTSIVSPWDLPLDLVVMLKSVDLNVHVLFYLLFYPIFVKVILKLCHKLLWKDILLDIAKIKKPIRILKRKNHLYFNSIFQIIK